MPALIEQIALVEHDEIGAGDLILEHLFDRIVMIERVVGLALRRQRIQIERDAAVGQRRAVDHRDHAIHRHAALDRRPMERLDQRLRQRQAGGLDHDVLDPRHHGEDGVQRRHEFVGHGAAQAAVGKLDDVLLGARGVAAAFEDLAVDADVAELVDDHRQAAPAGVGQHVADQRRLPGAEKAGDDRAWDARKRGDGHSLCSEKSNGGTRAMSPRFSASGRPRQGIRPSAEPARSFAPCTSACASAAGSRWPNT